GGGHRLPDADRRDPRRRAQAAAREAARGSPGTAAGGRRGGDLRGPLLIMGERPPRKRLRDLGIPLGRYPTGPWNAITDVAGVKDGHTTLILGEGKLEKGKGPVRTGITCVVPHDDIFRQRLIGGTFVLNGAGEVAGMTQVSEWGLVETPILLTNTMS